MPQKIYTLAERPDLRSQVSRIYEDVWPTFMNQDPIANRTWDFLFDAWAEWQVALCDENGTVVAGGNAVPLVWDVTIEGLPSGWDAAAEQAMRDHAQSATPTALSAYAIVVAPDQQGKGLSSVVLDGMAALARQHGLLGVIACVRPTLKATYPLTPFERYVHWKREDGLPFDPWIRVYWRAGARLARVSPDAMKIKGTVAEWEEWTGLRFPESGQYVVPGALQPVAIDVEGDLGVYFDPNVWMVHHNK